MKQMKRLLAVVALSLSFALPANAQRVSVGTNLLQWANLGTINAEFGYAPSRHLTLTAAVRFNGWHFDTPEEHLIVQNRQKTASIGIRYWPWYVYSGWWFGVKGQFKDFDASGIWRPALNTGTSLGAGVSAGYTLLLHERLNLDFGIGAWGGRMLNHTLYECPVCLDVRETGPGWFAGIDDISVSIIYIFGNTR